jgi:hypothetical protein
MPAHPRASDIHGAAGAALNGCVLVGVVREVDAVAEAAEGNDVDGPTVDEKERVVLASEQNCCARFSAEGTLALQLAATQL